MKMCAYDKTRECNSYCIAYESWKDGYRKDLEGQGTAYAMVDCIKIKCLRGDFKITDKS